MKIANLLITYETSLKIKSSDPTKVIFVSINSHFLQLLPLRVIFYSSFCPRLPFGQPIDYLVYVLLERSHIATDQERLNRTRTEKHLG